MKTRKEIRDKYGDKSVYMLERLFGNGWSAIGHGYSNRKSAMASKNQYYYECKKTFGRRIGHKHFRIALYVRAE